MSFSLPRFAKTNGRTQKPTDVGEERESPTARSPSFLQSLKRRLSGRSMGSTNSFDADSTPLEDKSYFSKTSGTSTMARHINAFAWVRLLAGIHLNTPTPYSIAMLLLHCSKQHVSPAS